MSMHPRPRVHYDAIAHLYDRQPYRGKTVDPELLAFVAQRAPLEALSRLDVGCGTGNQVVANRAVVPHARLVGVDRSLGMAGWTAALAAQVARTHITQPNQISRPGRH